MSNSSQLNNNKSDKGRFPGNSKEISLILHNFVQQETVAPLPSVHAQPNPLDYDSSWNLNKDKT